METIVNVNTTERKPYVKPEVLHDLEIETRASSPLGEMPGPLSDIFRNDQ